MQPSTVLHFSTAHSTAVQVFSGCTKLKLKLLNLKHTKLKENKQTNDCTALSIKALHTIAVQAFAGQANIFNQLFAFLLLVPVSL